MFNKRMQKLGEERSVIRELFEYGNARKKEIGEENVFDFSLGNPSVLPPESVNAEVTRLLAEHPAAIHGYTSAAGAPEVRRAVAEYLKGLYGIPMSENLIYMTCGAAASLTVTLSALCVEGDEVVLLAPYFPEYAVFVRSAGATPVVAATDGHFRPSLKALDRAVGRRTKAVIVNSPNNPAGTVYTAEELEAIAGLLRRKSETLGRTIFLLSDEPYRELCYGGAPAAPAAIYENTVVLYSFSKSLSLAGERIGYIAVPPRCAGSMELFSAVCGAGRALGYVCAPSLFQRVVAANLGQRSDIGEYRANRDLLFAALTEAGFSCIPPEGAFYLFVKSPEPDAVKFCERAKKHELLIVPSDSFGVKGYARISYCVPRAVIERSIPAFRALAEEYGLL